MNAVLREYILKGVFLGLWAYLAVLKPDWLTVATVLAWVAGGLLLGLMAGAGFQLVRGYRPLKNPVGFLLLTLLDSPFFIFAGVIGGLGLGVGVQTNPPEGQDYWLAIAAVGGAVLGYGFFQLRQVKDKLTRFVTGLLVGGILVAFAITYLEGLPSFALPPDQQAFARVLLLGLPFFYLLTFCGEAEESEVEFAALAAGLGIGLYLLRLASDLPEVGDKALFILPIAAYFGYVTWVMPGLRVFKHTLRGFGQARMGRTRDALASFGRALQLDPRSETAARGLWDLHRRLDVHTLDDDTAKLLNYGYCLDLAAGLVIGEQPPTETERGQAIRMLDMVEQRKPEYAARVDYLRAVTLAHAKQFDEAAGTLAKLLDPETPYHPVVRKSVLYSAWDLALRLHPELVKRLGTGELAKSGRRIEAIGAVERLLAKQPDDAGAVELKRELYSSLNEGEFAAAAATATPTDFNYDYVEQLGLALIADPAQVDRGMGYLRIAGRGLPARGPIIFKTLADLATKLGRGEEAHGYLGQVKRAGLMAGPANLPADQKEIYFATLRALSDAAAAKGDFAAAVDDQRLYVEAGREDVNSLRKLAELYALNKDPLNALLIAEKGLLYSKADRDLLDKKASYYYSVTPDRVAAVKDKVSGWFDADYCLRTAQKVADQRDVDSDTIAYALHLLALAKLFKTDSLAVKVVEARLLLRQGDRDRALVLLEDVREAKKGTGEDEDAWYIATKLLGDLYLNDLERPDLAIHCYTDYREYQRSGADTLFLLGRAYEATKNVPAAIRSYEAVTAYQNHPRYWEATEAARRLKESGAA